MATRKVFKFRGFVTAAPRRSRSPVACRRRFLPLGRRSARLLDSSLQLGGSQTEKNPLLDLSLHSPCAARCSTRHAAAFVSLSTCASNHPDVEPLPIFSRRSPPPHKLCTVILHHRWTKQHPRRFGHELPVFSVDGSNFRYDCILWLTRDDESQRQILAR